MLDCDIPEPLRLAKELRTALELIHYGRPEDIDEDELRMAAGELETLHARVQELEEFARAISQYGVLLRAGGAAPHDLKDLSAALADCVQLTEGVLK